MNILENQSLQSIKSVNIETIIASMLTESKALELSKNADKRKLCIHVPNES